MNRGGFGALKFVTMGTFHVSRYGETEARERFISEWRKDQTCVVRTFQRSVRAGGATDEVVCVVVRRKAEAK